MICICYVEIRLDGKYSLGSILLKIKWLANPDGYFQVQKRLGKRSSATFMLICVALYITNAVAFKKKKRVIKIKIINIKWYKIEKAQIFGRTSTMFFDLTCELHYILILLIKHLNHQVQYIYQCWMLDMLLTNSIHKTLYLRVQNYVNTITGTLLIKSMNIYKGHVIVFLMQQVLLWYMYNSPVVSKQTCQMAKWGYKCGKHPFFNMTWHILLYV